MKNQYADSPEALALAQERDKLHQTLAADQFSSVHQREAVQLKIDKINAELELLLELGSHPISTGWKP